ncbi:MAG: hypothetical protein ACQET8_20355 [Bacillota bacterium]
MKSLNLWMIYRIKRTDIFYKHIVESRLVEMKKRTRGEERFVSNVLEAVIRNNTKLLHGLFLIHGQHH